MGCAGCSIKDNVTQKNGNNYISSGCDKLSTYDWLDDLPPSADNSNIVEIHFKNTRKEYYINKNEIALEKNMLVTVEAPSGHDVGTVSLKGRLAELQLKRKIADAKQDELKAIYRKATANDIQMWQEAKKLEDPVMLKTRQITRSLGLEMKLSDVEFQADKKKATFYYIAEQRVDFRELIKILAEEFSIKIEMKQIGVRQEAGRIGGIGSCGRELCCSTWRTELPTVQQSAVIRQNLPLNSEKYLGQCGKLKCCLTYELETYLEAKEEFPKVLLELEAKHYTAHPAKIDILKKVIWYSYRLGALENMVPLSIDRVKEILMQNKKGIKPEKLEELD